MLLSPPSHDPSQIEEAARQAARALAAGELVAFPTETVYGVAALASHDDAVARLRAIRGMGADDALTLHIAYPEDAGRWVDVEGWPALGRFIRKCLPGPVTLVVEGEANEAATRVAEAGLTSAAGDLLYAGGAVSLRCPDHALTQAVLDAATGPVVAIAAATPVGEGGESGGGARIEAARTAEEVERALGDRVALVLDGGRCRFAQPSTVVRVRRGDAAVGGELVWTLEREGVLDERTIRRLARRTILLVCSGNTCRSPMGEAVARDLLARRRGLGGDELEAAGVRVISAGLYASAGSPATAEAVDVLRERGLDLSSHRSQPLTPQLVLEADVIYTMTRDHRRAILEMLPSAADKTHTLEEGGDVEDPIGTDAASYARTADDITRLLERRLGTP